MPRAPRSKLRAPRTPRGRLAIPNITRTGLPPRSDGGGGQLATEVREEEVPSVDWKEFLSEFKWRAGEHVTLIGPTGLGKTTLALQLIRKRSHMVAFGTKKKDDTLYPDLERLKFRRETHWVPQPDVYPRVLLVPPLKDTSQEAKQRQAAEFRNALDNIFIYGGWGLFLDEMRYITETLRLQENVELLYLQGRSLGVSIISLAQRPTWIPLVALGQATHLFMWRTTDRTDLVRLAEVSGLGAATVMNVVPDLQGYDKEGRPHEFLYLNLRTGEAVRSLVRR